MKLSCYVCGYESRAAAFFRMEPCGPLGGVRPVCEVCPAHARTAAQRRVIRQAIVGAVSWIVFIPSVLAISDVDHASLFYLFFAAVILTLPLATVVHELGHAVFGRAAGLKVVAVLIGQPPWRILFRVGKTSVSVSRYPPLGGRTHFADLNSTPARWRAILGLVGGAAGNLTVAVVLLALADGLADVSPRLSAFLAGTMIAQGFAGVGALIPMTGSSGLHSDGRQLLALFSEMMRAPGRLSPETVSITAPWRLLSAERYAEANRSFRAIPEEALREQPDLWVSVLSMRLHCLSRASGDGAALADYLGNRQAYDGATVLTDEIARPHIPLLQANIAWALVKANHADLSEAERLARAVLAAQPEENWSKGTLGAILVATGDAAEGASLLRDAVRQTEDPIDRSDFCQFLARAQRALANLTLATEFERAGEYARRVAPLPA